MTKPNVGDANWGPTLNAHLDTLQAKALDPTGMSTAAVQALLDGQATAKGTQRLAAGTLTLTARLFIPPGVTLDCERTTIVVPVGSPIVNEGRIVGATFSTASDADAVIGGELVNCTAGSKARLRPHVRDWFTRTVATRLSQARDSGWPLRVTVFGDSLAEKTDSTSWFKLLSDPASADPSIYLGASLPYAPDPTDWTNRAIGGSTSKLLMAHLAVTRPWFGNGRYNGMWLGKNGRVPARIAEMDLAIIVVGQNGGWENNATVDTCVRLLVTSGVDVLLVATNQMDPASQDPQVAADRAWVYRRLADHYGIGLVDMSAEFAIQLAKNTAGRGGYPLLAGGVDSASALIVDNVHPTAVGRKLYAQIMRDQIVRAKPGPRVDAPPTPSVLATSPVRRTRWGHQPRCEYVMETVGSVTREPANFAYNPRSGVDLTSGSNGAYVLPAAATYTDYIRAGSDGAHGVTLIVLGNGADQTFEVAGQAGSQSLGTVTVAATVAGRIYTAEALIPDVATVGDRDIEIKSSTGGKIIGVLFHEPGRKINPRNPYNGVIDGLRFVSGTWTLANYRAMDGTADRGQLYGTDSDVAAIEFDFEGTGAFVRLGGIGQAFARYQAAIDGVNYGTVLDGYNANSEPAYINIEVTGLPPGRHTMKVSNVGTNASATASPGAGGSRRMIVAQIGTTSLNPVPYL